MASVAKVRVHDDGSYDVALLGLSKEETMAVREAFSALEVNRSWATGVDSGITEIVRQNPILSDLHEEYKRTIRDVALYQADEELEDEEDLIEEDEDEFSDWI